MSTTEVSPLNPAAIARRLWDAGMRPEAIGHALDVDEETALTLLMQTNVHGDAGPYPNDKPGEYTPRFKNVLKFTTVEDAQATVDRVRTLFQEFLVASDGRGMWYCEALLLRGIARARSMNKTAQAEMFATALVPMLFTQVPPAYPASP